MGGVDTFEIGVMAAKIGLIVVVLLQVVPIMVWVERRGSAWLQNRSGPNRIGPFGLLQSLVDAVKMMFKEDRPTEHVNKFYYRIAPVVSLIPAFMTFAAIPFASSITLEDGRSIQFQIADLNVGLLYILSITSLSVYGIIMGSWASNNKYSIFGGLRSTAQMISYELSMGLSIIGIVMIFQSIKLGDIAAAQGAMMHLGPLSIPKWGIFLQPIGFLIFITCTYAETNRLPFDLPEGEAEIVAGYHLEYYSMMFGVFMMAEYINMTVAAAFTTTLYFGGWQLLPGMQWVLDHLGLQGMSYQWARIAFEAGSFTIKVAFFMWLFVWVRWTLPRFRYDQLMDLGWKVLLPLSLANIFVTGLLIYLKVL
jgi:NADH-quinone oxidoreductase subunit H